MVTLRHAFTSMPRPRPDATALLLTGLPLSTGAALVAFIVLRAPMLPTVGFLLAAGAASWALLVPRLPADARWQLKRRVVRGAIAGPAGLAAYDLTRFGIVSVATMSFQPFHVFPLFGHALLGPDISELAATAAGLGFHLTNGIGFAIAFAVAVSRPTLLRGVAWALCLETAMLLLYPGWLGISLTGELLPVSLAGHLAYGSVLGITLARLTP